ncbi:Nramp family divalent metal transporter [Salinicola endophyticus]|uniref:Nramp family divalent metal transporter n=1 Tax=Salinicola endophyticus TaxID=1949083 RepID=A0AB74U5G6_9GAMM
MSRTSMREPASASDVGPQSAPLLPRTAGEYIRCIGPGLVLAMAFLGTGDLVSSTVSGANYGYALMWTLVVALFARYCMISAIAKYKLENRFGDTSVLQGFQRVWRGFPMFFGVAIFFYGIIIQMSFLRACAVALYQLSGELGGATWGYFVGGTVVVVATIVMLARRNAYQWLEWTARIASVVIIATFVGAIVATGHIDLVEMAKGLTFSIPADNGPFDAIFIAIATIGTIGGSALNLLYPYFMDERGWNGPRYRRLQQFDLMAGMLPLLIINVLFWVVAAETIRGTGMTVSNENDLATMMQMAVGPMGPALLWISLFLAAFSSFPANARGFANLMFNGLHLATRRGKAFAKPAEDPWYNRVLIAAFIVVPLFICMPQAPNLVYLSVFGTSVITAILLPPILFGVLRMTSSRQFMLDEHVNRWWQTLILVVLSLIGLWSLYAIVDNLIQALGQLG